MENQYFTPNIEDIRIGYECELRGIEFHPSNDPYETDTLSEEDTELFKNTIAKKEDFHMFTWISSNRIRTPFLTKEQIEKEGWGVLSERTIFSESKDLYTGYYRKYEYELYYNYETKILSIYKGMRIPLICDVKCKDINTLRYMMKIFNIE